MTFTAQEETRIVEAIRQAEQRSSGELRVFVEDVCERDHPVERAEEVFALHGMHHTEQRNAVLIYIARGSRQFAIWGDVGIHERVGFRFWESEKRLLLDYLRRDEACAGLCAVIEQVGEQLRAHFPLPPGHTNPNELSDDIIYG
jgi:uncharacterized membrane protein